MQRELRKNNVVNSLYVVGNGVDALAMLRGQKDPAVPPEGRLILPA